MKTRQSFTALVCALLILFLFPIPVSAARGTPESLEFAYGVCVDVNGQQVENSLKMAADMKLDWVALDFDWAVNWPEPAKLDENSAFMRAMSIAQNLKLNVLVSVKNAPAWAASAQGPDAGYTAALVSELAHRFPATILAIELYPAANTRAGWGAAPSPAAYANLLNVVQARIVAENLKPHLVAGGMSNTLTDAGDMADVDFLQGLYSAGARPAILSLRFSALSGTTLDEPAAANLRHYEQIRNVMTSNGHTDGLLWITSLGAPSGITDPAAQDAWLTQAYEQLKTQLYMGAVFYGEFNPSADGTNNAASLLRVDSSAHPFLQTLGRFLGQATLPAQPETEVRVKKLEISSLIAQILALWRK